MQNHPTYNLEKIKFATDAATFEKAVELYENNKVTQFREEIGAYTAVVLGSKPYRVTIEARRYAHGRCTCYLGERDMLCKHLVAVAIRAVTSGAPLSTMDKRSVQSPTCSGRSGTLGKTESAAIKKNITAAMRYIKPYVGPSRTWFAYQNSLQEGCSRLATIISDLPVGEQTAQILIDMLLRLDDKLCRSGVDDSDGTVGGFIEETVSVLTAYAALDPSCVTAFVRLNERDTCFDWEKPLTALIRKI